MSEESSTSSVSPLTKIPILQTVFLFASKKLSTPIKLAQVTSTWDETLRVYGAGALVWQKAYQAKPAKVTGFLHAACAKGGFPWVVEHLLAAGVDPNSTDKPGFAAIHHISKWCALSRGAVDCIPILVKAGANVDIKTKKGQTPLFFAIEIGQADAVRALLKHGADPKQISFPLHLAACSGNAETCRLLVNEAGYDVNEVKPNCGWTPLLEACYSSRTKRLGAVKCLIKELKADVTIRDSSGNTPFLAFCTTYTEYPTSATHLHSVNETSIQDWLDVHPEVVRDIQTSPSGKTPIHLVGQLYSTGLTSLSKLIAAGGNINDRDGDGNTLLMDRVKRWGEMRVLYRASDCTTDMKIVKALIEQFNADVFVRNNEGHDVLSLMEKNPPHEPILAYLKDIIQNRRRILAQQEKKTAAKQ